MVRAQSRRGKFSPRLWPVPASAALMLLTGGAVGCLTYFGLDRLSSSQGGSDTPSRLDVIQTTLAILAFVGALFAGLYAYRRQRIAEGDSARADEAHLITRLSAAAEQVGHENPTVKLAGIYALANLADDWPEQRQGCIDLLCAYMRMPYEHDPDSTRFSLGEREIRFSIISLVRERLLRDDLRTRKGPTWHGCTFDFTGATLDGGDLSYIRCSPYSLRFKNALFVRSPLKFDNAELYSGHLDFKNATFRAGGGVTLDWATLAKCSVDFDESTWHQGSKGSFRHATLQDNSSLRFPNSTLEGSIIDISDAGLTRSHIDLSHCELTAVELELSRVGATEGMIDFRSSRLTGGSINFGGSQYEGTRLYASYAKINGTTIDCSGTFDDAGVFFNDVHFSAGVFDFSEARFRNGTLTFESSRAEPAASIRLPSSLQGTEFDPGPFGNEPM